MAPEHEARPRADFYDHESDEPRRRRRPAADWGVAEDIFDRMPSRRFSRTERRAERHDIVVRRGDEPRPDDAAWGEADVTAAASVDSWMDERRLVPGESRTIVLGGDGAPETPRYAPTADAEEPNPRRTVKISGHPDRLPVPRTQRPPRTAVERIGASPDRIVAYAVALGFLLVLIAVLTTGH